MLDFVIFVFFSLDFGLLDFALLDWLDFTLLDFAWLDFVALDFTSLALSVESKLISDKKLESVVFFISFVFGIFVVFLFIFVLCIDIFLFLLSLATTLESQSGFVSAHLSYLLACLLSALSA